MLSRMAGLAAVAVLAVASPLAAQEEGTAPETESGATDTPSLPDTPTVGEPGALDEMFKGDEGDVVVGATPRRVEMIKKCPGRELKIAARLGLAHRATVITLCSKEGATDAEWVETLNDAKEQLAERDMPASARQQLVAQIDAEIARFAAGSQRLAPVDSNGAVTLGAQALESPLEQPREHFEVSQLPKFEPKARVEPAAEEVARPDMAIAIKCLDRGERGKGHTCAFFDSHTRLAVWSVKGLEHGATLRFRRRGEERASVDLSPLTDGNGVIVNLPGELCKGVKNTKVDIELLAPGTGRGKLARSYGPYGLRC